MIKIEVTGNSIAEVSDKLLAIGASLQRTVSYDADNAAREALQAARDADKPTVGTEAAKRTRKAKPAEEGNVPPEKDASASNAEEASAASSPDTNTGELAAAEEAEAPKTLNFDKEVAPLVLKLVQTKGPEAIKAILNQFGVQRASQIDPARFGELVDLVQDAL